MRSFRVEKIGSVVRDVVGEALVHRLQDPRIASLTSVTRVEMTRDLQIARVYLAVPGDERAERKTMAALLHATGFLKRLLGAALSLRHCPELRFEIDEAAKLARRTLSLIEENKRRLAEEDGARAGEQHDAGDAPGCHDAEASIEGGADR